MGFERVPDRVREIGLLGVYVADLVKGLDATKVALPEVIDGLKEVARLRGIIFEGDEQGEIKTPESPAAEV